MPRGYRRVILALGGVVLLTAASPKGQDANGDGEKAERQIAQALSNIDASLQQANKPDKLERACDPEKPDRDSDLCAQWQAADAAVESAIWTRRSFYLGLAGSIIGILTLIAAAAAAKFAKDAAVAARAAIEATVVATGGRVQVIKGGSSIVGTHIALTNQGQSSAMHVVVSGQASAVVDGKEMERVVIPEGQPFEVSQGATHFESFSMDFKRVEEMADAALRGAFKLKLICECTYKTVFGNQKRAVFTMTCEGVSLLGKAVIEGAWQRVKIDDA